jgi:hypothetical protein
MEENWVYVNPIKRLVLTYVDDVHNRSQWPRDLRRPIHVRVWLASPARRGAGLGLISPHTYERGDPHTYEFGSLEPEPSRTFEPDSYVYGTPKA